MLAVEALRSSSATAGAGGFSSSGGLNGWVGCDSLPLREPFASSFSGLTKAGVVWLALSELNGLPLGKSPFLKKSQLCHTEQECTGKKNDRWPTLRGLDVRN